MPQTKEAISHAKQQVFIIFAINKVDKPNANQKNKRKISRYEFTCRRLGGKIQLMISHKVGTGVKELLEKYYLKQKF
jgi:translation initiation factor IF-2